MSGLLRRLRPSSDAPARASDGTAHVGENGHAPVADAPADVAEPHVADAPADVGPEVAEPPVSDAPADVQPEAVEPEAAEPQAAEPATAELEPETEPAAVAAEPPAEEPTRVMPAMSSGGLPGDPDHVPRTRVTTAPLVSSGGLPGDAQRPVAAAVAVDADDIVEERPLPAGVAPEDLIGERPNTRRRGRLRRRARHLRRVRELMLRDIGGLVYEIHRTEPDPAADEHRKGLVHGKLDRLAALDAERGELETTLGLARRVTVLREAGVGGTCPACAEYFASDARFCFRCGTRVDGAVASVPAPQPAPLEVAEADAPVAAVAAPPEPEPPTEAQPPAEAEPVADATAPAEAEPVADATAPTEADAETEPVAEDEPQPQPQPQPKEPA